MAGASKPGRKPKTEKAKEPPPPKAKKTESEDTNSEGEKKSKKAEPFMLQTLSGRTPKPPERYV